MSNKKTRIQWKTWDFTESTFLFVCTVANWHFTAPVCVKQQCQSVNITRLLSQRHWQSLVNAFAHVNAHSLYTRTTAVSLILNWSGQPACSQQAVWSRHIALMTVNDVTAVLPCSGNRNSYRKTMRPNYLYGFTKSVLWHNWLLCWLLSWMWLGGGGVGCSRDGSQVVFHLCWGESFEAGLVADAHLNVLLCHLTLKTLLKHKDKMVSITHVKMAPLSCSWLQTYL